MFQIIPFYKSPADILAKHREFFTNLVRERISADERFLSFGDQWMLAEKRTVLARGELRETSWPELRRQVAACAAAFKALGVQRGDRVCAVLPNVPETIVVFLACASLGAIWSVCSPDMGPVAVLARFRQIEPKLLVACDG